MLHISSSWIYSNTSVKTKSESKQRLRNWEQIFQIESVTDLCSPYITYAAFKEQTYGSVQLSGVGMIKGKTRGRALFHSSYLTESDTSTMRELKK